MAFLSFVLIPWLLHHRICTSRCYHLKRQEQNGSGAFSQTTHPLKLALGLFFSYTTIFFYDFVSALTPVDCLNKPLKFGKEGDWPIVSHPAGFIVKEGLELIVFILMFNRSSLVPILLVLYFSYYNEYRKRGLMYA